MTDEELDEIDRRFINGITRWDREWQLQYLRSGFFQDYADAFTQLFLEVYRARHHKEYP